MRIVHFSNNSLAGVVLLLVRAINEHTGHSARLVDARRYSLDESGWFEHDVVFSEDRDQALELAGQADVIHLHNFLDLDSEDFAPLNFRALAAKGTAVVRQFHSLPSLVAQRMGRTESEILNDLLPSLVIGHYPERFYPRARVVPNLLPIRDPEYGPGRDRDEVRWDLVFSPSKPHSAWENRWNTKGKPETEALLARVAEAAGARVLTLHGRPRSEVLAAKRAARVVVDDLSNGSIHLSGLEGLCLGKAVAGFLDPRQERVLAELTGAPDHPWINVRLEEAGPVLERLVSDPGLAGELGRAARQWVEERYDDARLVEHYVRAYEELVRDGELARQPGLALDTPKQRYFAVDLPETLWRARAAREGKQ